MIRNRQRHLLDRWPVLLAATLVLGVAAGLAPVKPVLWLPMLALAGAVGVVMLVQRPGIALLTYVGVLYLANGITNERVRQWGIGRWFTWLPVETAYLADAILFLLLILTALRLLVGALRQAPGRYDILILLLLIGGLASWYVNRVPFDPAIAAFRLLGVMVAGYFVLRYLFGPGILIRVMAVLWCVSILQFPLTILQRFIGVTHLGWGDDLISGTFSRDPKLTGFQMAFFALGVAAWLQPVGTPWRRRFLLSLVAAVGSLALSNSRAAFAFMPLAALIVLGRHARLEPRRVLRTFGALAAIYAAALGVFALLYGGFASGGGREVLMYVTTPSAVVRYFTAEPEGVTGGDGRVSRVGAIPYLIENLDRYPGGLPLGVGPGLTTRFKYGAASADLALSSLGVNITQAGTFLAEFGLVGLILSLALVVAGLQLARSAPGAQPLVRIIVDAYPAYVAIFLLLQFYSRAWFEAETAFLFWTLTVLVMTARDGPAPQMAAR